MTGREAGPDGVAAVAARGTVLLTAAHGALMVAGYFVAVVLARELGPARYGVYGIVYSVLLGAELIGRLGVPQALSRLIAECSKRAPGLEGTGVTLTALIYLAVFLGFWLGGPVVSDVFNVRDGGRLFRIAALDIPFLGLYFVASHVLNGRRDFAAEAAGVAVYAGGKVVGILLLLATRVTIIGALLVNVFASVVALGFVLVRVGPPSLRVTLRERGPLIRLAIPIGLFALGLQLLSNLDLWALNALGAQVSERMKGLYVAAMNLARMANVVAFVLSGVLVPSIARALAEGDDHAVHRSVRGAGRFLFATLLPGYAVGLADAAPIMSLVFSQEYRDGASLLGLLLLAHGVLYTLFVSFSGMLIGAKSEREAAGVSLAAIPVALVLNVLLVRSAGSAGAAAAAILAIGAATLVAGFRVHRRLGAVVGPAVALKSTAVAVGLWALATWIPAEGLALLLELAVLGGVYVLAAFVLGLVRRQDLVLLTTVPRKENAG